LVIDGETKQPYKLDYRVYQYNGEEDYNPYGGHQLSKAYMDFEGRLYFGSPKVYGSEVSEEQFKTILEDAKELDYYGLHFNKVKSYMNITGDIDEKDFFENV
jgi:hypothetical protein